MSDAYGELQTVAPTKDPVTEKEVLAHLKIIHLDEAQLIADKLQAAIVYVENQTNRQLVRATWEITFDRFPTGRLVQYLPKGQLASVDQIVYLDAGGTSKTITSGDIATDYKVSTTREPGRMSPVHGTIWPISRAEEDSVVYTLQAGYLDPASVDPRAKAAILLVLGHFLENREDSTDVAVYTIPLGAKHIIEGLIYDDFVDYTPRRRNRVIRTRDDY